MTLQPLDPRQLSVLRIRAFITTAIAVGAALVVDLGPLRSTPLPPGILSGAVAAVAIALALWSPGRRYRSWGYAVGEDEIHIQQGLWTRVRTIVPFGRVQHIDVAQGPVERRFRLATQILHTAGTRGAAVPLPGLPHDQAELMRDRIRAKIRQELS